MKRIVFFGVVVILVIALASCWPGSIPLVPKTLLIDDIHNNAIGGSFNILFAKFIQEFQAKGYSVSLASSVGFSPENYGAVLIAVPELTYTAAEKNKLSSLLSRGGKIILLGEWYSYYNNAPMNAITAAIGVNISFNNNELLDNTNNYDGTTYWVTTTKFETHPLSTGLSKIVIFAGCTLNVGAGASIVARAEATSYTASVDTVHFSAESSIGVSQEEGYDSQVIISVPIVAAARVGVGKVFAVGDTNIFGNEPGSYVPGDYIDIFNNKKLLQNIIDW
ncbi:MAG TPA: hypothetical protein PK411_10705 [Mesotoga infera]|jgi:hypothetical protein|uniref:Uncharacterized protein n=1 Tax=Mesotoga infera TaxID=1236046 RepID=A0A7Z7PNW3_9BACT|nr:hypothetical protein [Mesotoga infera]NLI08921.1 hypothetical protein [Thermotogaceae bacterium]HRR45481.1 hypothetical protein [Mesotoga sp.]SSC12375.1 conserved protein of unknown function [Mesotoga infera]HNS68233.1 hypothetical protein [Mesotoga infera]HON28816.1 hypothetical protein [Mesotoga infera]